MDVVRWEQIKELFHAALEQPEAERAAFLATACGADAELRREVELLLAAHEEASGFLNAPALQQVAQRLVADEQPTQQFGTAIGQHLSHYKVLSRIGAGGMGEVYLARDAHLKRRVALKVLPLKFTRDPERLQRFIREAEAASALNHPNIITIYEIGVVDSERGQTHFIATEYIEGVTLRDWKPEDKSKYLSQTLEIGSQIASALEAAHHAGIVHRDIKPENLMVRPDGLVKVLDFGLAKLTATHHSGDNQIDTDAQTTPPEMETMPGLILGTLGYMSPEQARGQALDARTDIFSLGVVLYELLTGKPLFAGETTADVIAAIIHKEMPPLNKCLPDAPPELERILQKALAKDSCDRYQTARDLQSDLQVLKQKSELSTQLTRLRQSGPDSLSANAENGTSTTASAAWAAWPGWWRGVGAGVLTLLIALLVFWKFVRAPAPPPRDLQFDTLFGKRGQDKARLVLSRFSPNGKIVAFAASSEGVNIWLRQVSGERESQLTSGPWEENSPLWSPDGERIAFISNRGDQLGIWVTSLLGGIPTLLKKLSDGNGDATRLESQLIAWTKNEPAIYYQLQGQLFRLDLNSKVVAPVLLPAQSFQSPHDFALSPNEREFAFVAQQGSQVDIWRVGLNGDELQRVTNDSASDQRPVWLSDDKLLYNSTRDGRLYVYQADLSDSQPALIPTSDHQCQIADYSAASARLLCYEQRDESDIYTVQLATGEEGQVTNDLGAEFWSSTSPNGQTLLYQALPGERFAWNPMKSALFTKPIVANGQVTRMTAEGFEAQWSPDGTQIGFLRLAGLTPNLWVVKAAGGEEQQLVTSRVLFNSFRSTPPYNRTQPKVWSWSPDSRRIAYIARQTDAMNVAVVTVDQAQPMHVSSKIVGGAAVTGPDAALRLECPLWSPDGQKLAYVAESGTLSALDKRKWSVWATFQDQPALAFQTNFATRLLGWSANDRLIVALEENVPGSRSYPAIITLLELTLTGPRTAAVQRPIGTLTETYLSTVQLAPNGRSLAFVKAPNGRHDIWLAFIRGAGTGLSEPKKITRNPDPTFFFASPTWSPDGKNIYFDKQTRWTLLTMIDHFN